MAKPLSSALFFALVIAALLGFVPSATAATTCSGGVNTAPCACPTNNTCTITQPSACSKFPITISSSSPRSYVLGGPISLASLNCSASLNAINISQTYVTINLSSHSITGTGKSGTGIGISGASAVGVSISNGEVEDFGGDGISLGTLAMVTSVTADSNLGSGISVSQDSLLYQNTAESNSSDGLLCGANCVVDGNYAEYNGADGIAVSVTGGGTIVNNQSYNNTNFGLNLGTSPDAGFGSNTMQRNHGTAANCTSGTNCCYTTNQVSNSGSSMLDNTCNNGPG